MRQHGGTIRVESEPGQYTEMIIDLPLDPPPEPASAPSENAGPDGAAAAAPEERAPA